MQKLEQLPKSETMFRASLAARILCLGDGDKLVANTHYGLAQVLEMQGKTAEATQQAQLALDIRIARIGVSICCFLAGYIFRYIIQCIYLSM